MDSRNALAIVGMSCRFPGAPNVRTFWDNLRHGVESLRRFTGAELAAAGVPASVSGDPAYVPVNGALDGIEHFDAAFFAVTPRDAEVMDPQHRLFLECAWEALEAGGYRPGREAGRVGVYAGAGISTYLINNLLPRADVLARVGHLELLMANNKDFVPTRVAYKLDLTGPAVNANTACSTGLVNVHLACQSLLAFECDMALAGGVSVQVPQDRGYLYQPDGIVSPDGHCRAFDSQAAGTVSGNGAGVVLLKRLDDAIADGDHIHAVILGTAINNDGAAKAGFTAPSVSGQADVIAQALATAEVGADTIGYIETHGTGTPVGDPIEIAALTEAFRARTSAVGFCAIGTVKSNFGHLDEAAGIAGLIKATLALEHAMLPPTLHCSTPSPALQLESSPFRVNTSLRAWPGAAHPRRAGVSSFGLGGTNAHVILEQAPLVERAEASGRQVLALSARSAAALESMTQRLADALDTSPDLDPAAVAFTLFAGRRQFEHRAVFSVLDREDAVHVLRGGAPERAATVRGTDEPRDAVFMFPGHGVASAGMSRGIYDHEPVFRQWLDRCAEGLRAGTKVDIRDVIFSEGDGLRPVALAQPALFAVEYALAQLWMSWGVRPSAMIGHSAGEFVAACLAETFSLEDGLTIIAERGALMQQSPPGAMLAVALDEAALQLRLPSGVDLAVVMAPGMCVVAGLPGAIDAFRVRADADGIECRPVAIEIAAHSSLMDDAAVALKARMARIPLSPPRLRFISNVTGNWITAGDATSPDYWARHLRQRVRFGDGVDRICRELARPAFLEVGPGRSLAGPVLRHPSRSLEHPVITSMRHRDDQTDDHALLNLAMGKLWAHGVSIDPLLRFKGQARRRVPLPTYPFERKRFWIEPVAPLPAARSSVKRANVAEWLYLPSWQRSVHPDMPRDTAARSIVVIGAGIGLADQCTERLRAAGHRVDTVAVGAPLPLSLGGADTVIDLRACEAPSDDESTAARLFNGLIALAQALTSSGRERPIALTVVTSGAAQVSDSDQLDPARAAVFGVVQSLVQEYPHINCRTVDIAALADAGASAQVVAEAMAGGTDRFAALRGRHRWSRDYVPVGHLATAPPLAERGVYLITGGIGDVGTVIARYLARTLRARIIFVSRTRELDSALRRELEAAGAEVWMRHADVADEAAMRTVLDEVTMAFGRINGVIHAAGVTTPEVLFRPIPETDAEQVRALFRPKIAGTLVLERLLRDRPLDFCLLISSNASTLGGLGLAAYSAASHVLDAIAVRCRQAGQPWTSSNWDGWPAASAPAGSRHSGIEAFTMSPAEAEEAFRRVLSCRTERVVVSAGDLNARLQRAVAPTPELAIETGTLAATDPFDGTATEGAVIAAVEDLLGTRPVIRDNFFELGGDSLLGSRMMARLSRHFGVPLSVRMIFANPTLSGVAAQIDSVRAGDAKTAAITRIAATPSYAVSSTQRRLWILNAIDQSSAAYHVPLHQRLDGPLDASALRTAINALVDRHESLRTRFAMVDGEPRQFIAPALAVPLDERDVSGTPDPAATARALALAESSAPFDLEHGPLVRATLIRLRPDSHALLFTMHHIVADGVSIGVIGRDLSKLYEAARTGTVAALPPLTIHYRDFAAWQNALLDGPDGSADRDYWHAKLAGPLPVLDLIEDFPRPAVLTTRGREPVFAIPPELTSALAAIGRTRNASLFMVLLGALKVFLYRCTGQTDVIVGSPSAGRVHADLDDQVGCFLNTLALRDRIEPGQSFVALLEQVRTTATEAFEHQQYPFERLVSELQLPRDTARSPIFDVVMILQNEVENALALDGITASPFSEHNHTAKVDLSFNFKPDGAGLALGIEYNADLFLESRIAAMADQFQALLRSIVTDPSTTIDALALMSGDERERVVDGFNPARVLLPGDTVIGLFESRAAATPDAPAIRHLNQVVTYRALDEQATRLARHLSETESLGAGDLAVIAVPSGADLLASLLAVWKLRASAVLVEPSMTPERLAALINDSRCRVLVAADSPAGLASTCPVVALDHARDTIAAQTTQSLGITGRSPDDDVLVFYTSGSTGVPKGVRLTNRGIVNELDWFARYFNVTADEVLPQKTVLTFVDCIVELLLPLTMTGGAVHLRPDFAITGDLVRLAEWCRAIGATILQFVPEVFEELAVETDLSALTQLRVLILSGAAVRRQPHYRFRVFNLYGCSETSALATAQDISEPSGLARLPIGLPLQNTSIYILDATMAPCPIFVPGEIFVGGDVLSAGYLHNPAMTAARFVANPFDRGGRLFKTGDFGRWYADGSIDYLGRRDDQVKIRGQRIECGAVEYALCSHPDVREAAVTARSIAGREPVLVAYIAGESVAIEREAVRAYLSAMLPDYMIPTIVVALPALPRTSSGKIDRRALPEPDPVVRPAAIVAPRNATEEAIAAIWCEVLEMAVVGIHDDFLALGGHSLKATRVASRMARDLGLHVSLTDVFRHPTIAELAAAAHQRGRQAPAGIGAATETDAIAPLTAAERELLG